MTPAKGSGSGRGGSRPATPRAFARGPSGVFGLYARGPSGTCGTCLCIYPHLQARNFQTRMLEENVKEWSSSTLVWNCSRALWSGKPSWVNYGGSRVLWSGICLCRKVPAWQSVLIKRHIEFKHRISEMNILVINPMFKAIPTS